MVPTFLMRETIACCAIAWLQRLMDMISKTYFNEPPLVVVRIPCCHTLSYALFEGEAEGAVASVAAVVGKLLDSEGLLRLDGVVVAAEEMVDAKVVNIGIVVESLVRKILTEIVAVSANGLGKLQKGQVVL